MSLIMIPINILPYLVCIDYGYQMKNNIFSALIVSGFIVSSLWSGTDGQIRGNITNVEGEVLLGAQVYIAELGIGAVADLNGGAFFHVGDGAGAAFTQISDLETTVSKPQNGEYANETYFLTMDDWEDYLRITPFDEFSDTILLMSDGVTPMAMSQGCAAPEFKNFVNPVIKFLRDNDNSTGETGVTNTLSGDNVRKITGDDKTLLWAIRAPG